MKIGVMKIYCLQNNAIINTQLLFNIPNMTQLIDTIVYLTNVVISTLSIRQNVFLNLL